MDLSLFQIPNKITNKALGSDSEKEPDANISDNDDHISHSVPDSSVKNQNQLACKSLMTEEADPGL